MLQEDKQVWKYGFGVLAFISALLLVFFLSWSYAGLQALIIKFNQETDWLDITANYGLSESALTVTRAGLFLVASGSMAALFFLNRKEPGSALFSFKSIAFFWQKLKHQWQLLPTWEKRTLVLATLVLTAVRLYFFSQARIDPDEVATYILFVSRGLPGILLYYPFPNNHLLYSLLAYLAGLVLTDPFWSLKLPTLFLSIAGSLIFYLALRSVFSFWVVLLSVFALSFSYYPLMYATLGRGYWLQMLCAGLLALAVVKLYERREVFYWLVFLVCSIAGFFAIPTFLYPWLAMAFFAAAAFWVTGNKSAFRRLVICSFFAGMATILLYLPLLLVSGPKQLYANEFVVRLSTEAFWQKLPVYLPNAQGAVLGQETIGAYLWLFCFAVLSGLLIFRKKGPAIPLSELTTGRLAWIWCGAFLPWVFILVQGVQPPERSLIFKAFFDFLLVAVVVKMLLGWLTKNRGLLLMSILTAGLLVYSTYECLKLYRKNAEVTIFNYAADEIVEGIWKSQPAYIFANNPSSFHTHYCLYLRYRYAVEAQPLPIFEHAFFNPERKYDFLILEKEHPFPENANLQEYFLFAQNPYAYVYKRRNNSRPLLISSY